MTSKVEAATIRSQLALRLDLNRNTWQVHTTQHGTGIFRWFDISEEYHQWYVQHFPDIRVDDPIPVRKPLTGASL